MHACPSCRRQICPTYGDRPSQRELHECLVKMWEMVLRSYQVSFRISAAGRHPTQMPPPTRPRQYQVCSTHWRSPHSSERGRRRPASESTGRHTLACGARFAWQRYCAHYALVRPIVTSRHTHCCGQTAHLACRVCCARVVALLVRHVLGIRIPGRYPGAVSMGNRNVLPVHWFVTRWHVLPCMQNRHTLISGIGTENSTWDARFLVTCIARSHASPCHCIMHMRTGTGPGTHCRMAHEPKR